MLHALILASAAAFGQELYVASEPASNMPRHALGLRTTLEVMPNGRTRFSPEIMAGVTRDLMVHAAIYTSNIYRPGPNFASSFYAKYRFLSVDTVQRHFRGALFARVAKANNQLQYQEVNLEGDNSGFSGGFIFTRLVHKLALSASGAYAKGWQNGPAKRIPAVLSDQAAYSFSAGYLLFPKEYTDYGQINVNLYFELLGKSQLGGPHNYIEAAPAVQVIFGSRFRVDVSKRFQVSGDMTRSTRNMFLVRAEYPFFNVF